MFGFSNTEARRTPAIARPFAGILLGLIVSAFVAGCGGGDSPNSTAGTLDPSFGTANDGTPDGVVNLSLGAGNDSARAIAVQADGKIVVAGQTTSTLSGTTSSNVLVQRFNADGTVDATFGAGTSDGSPDGAVTLSLGDGEDAANAVAIQSDGRIVVVGSSTSSGSSNIVVARLNTNGTLDTGFGTANDGAPDGIVNLSLGDGSDVASAVAIQSDGRILIAGTTTSTIGGTTSSNIAVARLTTAGALDASFGAGTSDGSPDGVVTLSLGDGEDSANALAIQSDGKIVVVGTSTSSGSSNIVVARLNTNGTLDTGFGTANDGAPDGIVNLSLGDGSDVASAAAIQADGKILIAGSTTSTIGGTTSSNIAVARLTTAGALDASFGAGTSDGSPDGVVTLSLGNGSDTATGIAVQADGRIVVVGSTTSFGSSSNIVAVRLMSSGTLDGDFGQSDDGTPNGVVNLSLGDGNDFARAVTLQRDGRILIAGDRVNGASSDIVVIRMLAD